jgi:hypothetical protein
MLKNRSYFPVESYPSNVVTIINQADANDKRKQAKTSGQALAWQARIG